MTIELAPGIEGTVRNRLMDLSKELGVETDTDVMHRLTEYVAGQLGVAGVVKPRKAKLTWDKVDAIRERWGKGEAMAPLAEEFGVTYSTVSRIVTNKMWIKK